MDMTGQRTLQVTQQQAWEALNDPDILKACIPGCQRFEPSGDQKFAVAAGIKMGPVSAMFNGSVQLTDIVAPKVTNSTSMPKVGWPVLAKGSLPSKSSHWKRAANCITPCTPRWVEKSHSWANA